MPERKRKRKKKRKKKCKIRGNNMFFTRRRGHRFEINSDKEYYDIVKTAFTTDYEYHDLDLSAFIPVGTVVVLLWFAFNSNVANCEISWTKGGFTGTYVKAMFVQPILDNVIGYSVLVPVDVDRKIRYRMTDATYSYINVNVVGWFV